MMSRFFYVLILALVCTHATALRIVSLAPNLTEIVYSLGLGDDLVGNTINCDYPAAAKLVYKVGDYIQPNWERILSRNPDFVLATMGNPRTLLTLLKKEGITVLETNPKTLADLPSTIQTIADALGVSEKGQEVVRTVQQGLAHLASVGAARTKKPSFLFILQYDPVYSFSNETWIGDLFAQAGFSNLIGHSRTSYPVVSNEFLLKNSPDFVFTVRDERFTPEENLKIQSVKLQKIFRKKSIEKMKVILVPSSILMRASTRVLEGAQFLESISTH